MKINQKLDVKELAGKLERFFELAASKTLRLHKQWEPAQGAPVFTRRGRYTARGWTEWTQGFLYGIPLLIFDATGEDRFLRLGRENTLARMASHLTHIGVHDHGFNNISTYGNLWRMACEGRIAESDDAMAMYELALKVSGAVQAARWSRIADGSGFIHSFNGPHSLFSDTIRSCRVLVLADRLGHALMGENDVRISLMERAIQHIRNTLRYNVYYGEGRDTYDVPGRVAHEGIFNMTDGRYRCPGTQQGYSPFSTWTRGLAWILLGCAEQLEFFDAIAESDWISCDPEKTLIGMLRRAATVTAEFYIQNTAADGIPFWDTGAPGLVHMPDYREHPSQPDNSHEPVDSSAAAIAAQGLLRLGMHLGASGKGRKFWQAGLCVADTLLSPPYLSEDTRHHGLVLHSVYHRPNGWDYVPKNKQVPFGESSMWGDYHTVETALCLLRAVQGEAFPRFFGGAGQQWRG